MPLLTSQVLEEAAVARQPPLSGRGSRSITSAMTSTISSTTNSNHSNVKSPSKRSNGMGVGQPRRHRPKRLTSSPQRSTGWSSTISSSGTLYNHRLYKAPQATFRLSGDGSAGGGRSHYYSSSSSQFQSNSNAVSLSPLDSTAVKLGSSNKGNTRRRRRASASSDMGFSAGAAVTQLLPDNKHNSDSSTGNRHDNDESSTNSKFHHSSSLVPAVSTTGNGVLLPAAPLLWTDDVESMLVASANPLGPVSAANPSKTTTNSYKESRRKSGRRRSASRLLQVPGGDDDSDYGPSNNHPSSRRDLESHGINDGNRSPTTALAASKGSAGYHSRMLTNNSDHVIAAASKALPPASSYPRKAQQLSFNWTNVVQLLVLAILAVYLYDSHKQVRSHQMQLREYDEERSHILEQMMWIDKAAKKVHKKYSEKEWMANMFADQTNDNGTGAVGVAADAADVDSQVVKLQMEMEHIQRRIQTNARDHLSTIFGKSPAQISLRLPLSAGTHGKTNLSEEKVQPHLVIALSDDTPHAISTLVRQVNQHQWDHIQVTVLEQGRLVQLTSEPPQVEDSSAVKSEQESGKGPEDSARKSDHDRNRGVLTPVLEFVERSRGCREAGSVAVATVDTTGMTSAGDSGTIASPISLMVSLDKDATHPLFVEGVGIATSVCVGKVVAGLSLLEQFKA